MSRKDLAILLTVAAVFGASFLFIRVASPVLGPLPVSAGRVVLGALVPLALIAVTRQRFAAELRGRYRDLLVVGFLLAAFPFTLFAVAELRLPASLAAVLNATTPIWGIVVARIWLGTPATGRRPGEAAPVGHRDEGAQLSEIHASSSC